MNNNTTAQLYRIDKRLRGNVRMFSIEVIRPGQEIIAEAPLMSVPIALKDVYNPNQAFGTRSRYNVGPALDHEFDHLSADTQQKIRQLFCLEDDLLSVFACNAFEGEEKNGWQSRTVLRLFNDISRANHSCRPNAVYDRDPARGVGTLHALCEIPAKSEIRIEYYAHEATSLRKGHSRREELFKQYGFDCDCAACNESRQSTDNEDDAGRLKAARLWRSINKDQPHANESEEQAVHRKVRQTSDYVDLLAALEFGDLKLADGWGRAAELLEKLFDIAETDYHRQICQCVENETRIDHLRAAIRCLTEQIKYHICCWGPLHPDIAGDYEKMNALLIKMLQYQRSH